MKKIVSLAISVLVFCAVGFAEGLEGIYKLKSEVVVPSNNEAKTAKVSEKMEGLSKATINSEAKLTKIESFEGFTKFIVIGQSEVTIGVGKDIRHFVIAKDNNKKNTIKIVGEDGKSSYIKFKEDKDGITLNYKGEEFCRF